LPADLIARAHVDRGDLTMARSPGHNQDEQFSEQETQQRFERLVHSALNTKPKPLKDVPKKWSGAQRKRAKKRAAKK
jgi:hypothetical protein